MQRKRCAPLHTHLHHAAVLPLGRSALATRWMS
jgi:hypothetical protein